MDKKRLNLEPEVVEVFKCIDANTNFLLSGGAGSGKTYSLVQTINQVIAERPAAMIACITFTNAAVKEIESRINHKNLTVSTIHDFLWDIIKSFQVEIKKILVELSIDDSNILNVDKPLSLEILNTTSKGIQYKDYARLIDGIISHDELLIVSERLFEKYTKLCDIFKDRFDFVFIDEYQDTSELVINILLKHLKKSSKINIIGFFGDAMQAIYDDVIGDIVPYIGLQPDQVFEIKKVQNRRNPAKVIELANRLRTDGITQVFSSDKGAPNLLPSGQAKIGECIFIHSKDSNVDNVRGYLTGIGWNFANVMETKELNLTHNLIADKAGFRTLMDIYDKDGILDLKKIVAKSIKDKGLVISDTATFSDAVDLADIKLTPKINEFISANPDLYNEAKKYLFLDFKKTYTHKDQLIDDNKKGSKRDDLIKHLFRIQSNLILYKEKKFNEFMRMTDFNIKNIRDKSELKQNIEDLIDVGGKTIQDVITKADEYGICKIDDNLMRFKESNPYIFNRVSKVKFQEFQKLFDYVEGKTPFSTQHKTKGSQFDSVFVIMDNGKWNKYNFEKLFTETKTDPVLNRTQKIFYVCCTRAKEKLAIFYHDPSGDVIKKAQEWFGIDNVISL